MASEIHVNNIGTRFLVTIKDGDVVVDVSTASTLTMIFKKPDDEVIYRSATKFTNGTDGKIYYDTTNGDLDEAGQYKLQGKVIFPNGSTYYTDIHTFHVHCNL